MHWIPYMSLLSFLVNSFKFMLAYNNLYTFIDSYDWILEFICNTLRFTSTRNV